MDDPLVTEDQVPSYELVKEKFNKIDSSVIIARTFYVPDNLIYRFQLVRKDKMCIVEIPKRILDDLKNDNSSSEQELTEILNSYLNNSECWSKV